MNNLSTDVIPIVVTYDPDVTQLQSVLNALLTQTQTLLLVDNGSKINLEETLHNTKSYPQERIELLSLKQNLGLGAAYNMGIAKARQMGAEYILLMDQDSIPEPGMIGILKNSHQTLIRQHKKVAAVGVRYRSRPNAEYSQFAHITRFRITRQDCDSTNNLIQADFVISSGSLISINTLDEIGDMDESLFIDHIDTEWCLRAKSKGYEIYGCCHAKMWHSLGNKQTRIWLGRWRTIAYHQPFRYYYMVRNSVLLWQRPYIHAGWKRADKLRILYTVFFFSLFSPNRIKNLIMMINGFMDGFKGKTGKLIKPTKKPDA
ncbi:MAG: glycosyltransferase family 2 protein [Burkholderiales bacterium]|nr:glycosyltransferase family 2 protein [Nitrosomonas sp.]MCP5274475.1 glycosyltransferase family 2 protein [Burkholderiales bacterium]